MQNAINNFFKTVLFFLQEFFADFVSDPGTQWGLAIIALTVLFNIIVFPLNWKAMRSSKKMSLLQPELKKIQEAYKDDPAGMQQAQAKLMKDNNASMWAGCLPLLIQYPLFIALFNVFRNLAAENVITGMGFLGPIIPDLAATKNLILAAATVLAMLASTWLTQKANEKTMSEESKAQAKSMNTMSYVMSLLIGWFTYSSPAALGLYWVSSNLFRIVQQLIMNSHEDKNPEPLVPAVLPEVKAKRKRNKVVRR